MIVEIVILLSAAIYAFCKYIESKTNYFKGRNCKHDTFFPIFGSMKSMTFKKKSILDVTLELYQKAEGNKIFGIYENGKPSFYINDPELIRQITVKDFDHFVNHRDFFTDNDEGALFGKSLFSMKDLKWKHMRSTLSPAFTGSKMRMMFQLITDVAQQAVDFMKSKDDIKTGREVDIKDYFTHFTNDIIATVAFGIKVDSLKDENHEFYEYGKKVMKFDGWQIVKFFIYMNFKFVTRFVDLDIWKRDVVGYFKRLVLDAMNHRMEHKILRHDMINMLMEAKGMYVDGSSPPENSKPSHEWTDSEIVAQCFVFFIAGFDSAATLMSFVAHELMENPEVQEKLFREIEEVKESLDGKPLTYEACNKLKYMEMVISETLRKWPTAPGTDRVCTKTTTFENPDGLGDFTIKTGENVFIPIVGLHRDPMYFPNPTQFDPERFNEDNKNNIQPSTYIPFGAGPRACIANRFALMEAKAILFYLVGEFKLEPSKNSTIPLDLTGGGFQLKPKNGFWLKFATRSDE
ncbi:hypothetical protein ACFFRR_001051 [Megaselia abdita]